MSIIETFSLGKKEINEDSLGLPVWKLTALWAFSEAALGGVLHAFRVPLRGVFISGSAAILISLIAYYSNKKGTILKSTLLVILIKGLVSPHTPLTAYVAVFLQGVFGEIFFFKRGFHKISSLLLGISTLLYSSIHKLIILTVVFGNTLWESIDEFIGYILEKFYSGGSDNTISYSYLIIGAYLGLHLVIGLLIGIFTGKLPERIRELKEKERLNFEAIGENIYETGINRNYRKRKWWQRPTGILIFIFAASLLFISYLFPEIDNNKVYEIGIMLLRAIIILTIWYSLIGPLLLKQFRKYLKKKQNKYSTELTNIVDSFPQLRSIVSYCWKINNNLKGLKKLRSFITHLLTIILFTEVKVND